MVLKAINAFTNFGAGVSVLFEAGSQKEGSQDASMSNTSPENSHTVDGPLGASCEVSITLVSQLEVQLAAASPDHYCKQPPPPLPPACAGR